MSIFRAFDIRGRVPDEVDPEVAFRVGNALAAYLGGGGIAVGRDARKSSAELAAALHRGIQEAGADVIDIGMSSTPALYYAVASGGCSGGVEVTGGSSPSDINGFKLCREGAIPLVRETGLEEIQERVETGKPSAASERGSFLGRDISERYLGHLRGFIQCARPVRMVVDAGNGMGGVYWGALCSDLDCEIIGRRLEPAPDPVAWDRLCRSLGEEVRGAKADLGVALNADGVRAVFVDERGEIVPADYITALVAREALERWPGSAVVYDLRSSRVVRETVESEGGIPLEAPADAERLKRLMRGRGAVFGGDLDGRYFFRENYFLESALIALIKVLNLAGSLEAPISKLVEPLRKYSSAGRVSIEVADPDAVLEDLGGRFPDAEVYFLDGVSVVLPEWWANLRPVSGANRVEVTLEARSESWRERGWDRIREAMA
ncbi:MAG TPA: phosphomannomutase/phosphoglucomutase [bacterium]|nr:phosphomannomutase/phosphoglucomutase [bacterium]HPQ65781.1 phosphomannomutase/phosphoglucomutase [bacterium]